MSLILCPECGAKISDKAISCPHCGFVSENHLLPISKQDTYEPVPTFSYDIENWTPNQNNEGIFSIEDNRKLVQYFGNWNTIKHELPAIAQVIIKMSSKENVMIAKMDPYVKKLIKRGDYHFTIDKSGEILPTIRDDKGIVKQVRLEEIKLTPDLTDSLNNLATQAAMSQILDEIKYVGEAIKDLHIELQNDRIALAESTKDKLLFASKIQDAKLREIAILNALDSATDSKRILMRNFHENLQYITEHSNKNDFQLLLESGKGKSINQKANDAFQNLVFITNSVQNECYGYAMIGEYDSVKASLMQFKDFIKENKLDEKDALVLLNGNSEYEKISLVDEFMKISERIIGFDTNRCLNTQDFLTLAEKNENEKDTEKETE